MFYNSKKSNRWDSKKQQISKYLARKVKTLVKRKRGQYWPKSRARSTYRPAFSGKSHLPVFEFMFENDKKTIMINFYCNKYFQIYLMREIRAITRLGRLSSFRKCYILARSQGVSSRRDKKLRRPWNFWNRRFSADSCPIFSFRFIIHFVTCLSIFWNFYK